MEHEPKGIQTPDCWHRVIRTGGPTGPNSLWRMLAGGKCLAEHELVAAADMVRQGRTYLNLSKLREGLNPAGQTGTVEVRGYYTDQRDTKHFSDPFPIKVEGD